MKTTKSAKRARKPLAEVTPNIPAPKRQNTSNLKRALIKFTTLPPETFVPLDHPAPEHHAEVRIPEHTELTPAAFDLFWDDSILERIAEATNDYANPKRAAWSAKMPGTLQRQRRWKPLRIVELRRFLRITILTGIIRLPSRHLYWPLRRNSFLGVSGAALSFNRYTQIKRYLFGSPRSPSDVHAWFAD